VPKRSLGTRDARKEICGERQLMTLRHFLILGGVVAAAAAIGVWSHRQEVSQRRAALHDEQQSDAAVLAALARPIALDGQTVSLEQFAQMVEQAAGVHVVVDADELDAHPIWMPAYNGLSERSARAIPLQLPRARVPVSVALRLALAHSEIDYTVRDGQVLITLPEVVARQPLQVVVYPLPQPHFTGSEANEDFEWYNAVTTQIQPADWDDVGGVGHCQAVPGALVIAHQPRVHAEIGQLIERLSRLENPPQSWQSVPLWPIGNSQRLAAMLQKLRSPGKLNCREMPLDELADYLSDLHDVPIVLNFRALENAGLKKTWPITRTMEGVSLHSLLATALSDLDLTYVIEDGLIEITTPDDAESRLWTVAYPVHDLVTTEGGPDYSPLIDLIVATIVPDSWADVGGPGECHTVLGGWLIVSQTQSIHEQVEQLFRQLRRGLSHEEHPSVLAISAFPETDERILAALEREMPLELVSTRLDQLCRHLTEQTGVSVQLNHKTLADNGVNIDVPLTCSFLKAPLRVHLERLCEALEMYYVISGESLLLTTPDVAWDTLHRRLYDVRELIDPDLGLGDENWLIDLIENHVDPASWDSVGGAGNVHCFRGLLVVSQPLGNHREVAGLLEALARGNRELDGRTNASRPAVWTMFDGGDQALLAQLDRPVPVELAGMSMDKAIQALGPELQLPLRLDHAALAQAGRWPLDEPVEFSTRGLPLGVVLDRMLPEDLGHFVRHRELLVSSADRRERFLHTRLFDARRLAAGLRLGDERLCDLISTHVAPQTWDEVGGRGAISARRGLLFVTQTHEIQRQIESLLAAMAEVAGAQATDGTRSVPATLHPADETAFRSLAGIVDANLDGLPLDYACEKLSRLSGVTIWVDPRGIFGLGLFPDEEVAILPAARTLGGTLDAMLPEGLGYYVQGGQIVISAAEEVEQRLATRLYRVGPLGAPGVEEKIVSGAIEGLSSSHWSDTGGPGEITAVTDAWLLVTTDAVRHQQIERWLRSRQVATDETRSDTDE
jgi:hypothetical protein